MAVEITRTELSASNRRREAARANARASRRMLALALEGKSQTEAAESCGMDRQTLRDWVHRHNAEGLAGLSDRPLPGRPPRLSAKQMRGLATIVETGPDPCAGAGSICARWSSGGSACVWRSGRWARSFTGSALPACRLGPATRRANLTLIVAPTPTTTALPGYTTSRGVTPEFQGRHPRARKARAFCLEHLSSAGIGAICHPASMRR